MVLRKNRDDRQTGMNTGEQGRSGGDGAEYGGGAGAGARARAGARAGRGARERTGRGARGRYGAGDRARQGGGGRGKRKKGPSKTSGAISVGMGIFGMIWTFSLYVHNGPGFEALFGVIFVFMCLLHATFNFQSVKQQEAIDRGEIPDPDKKGRGRYPVYRVKRKPARMVSRTRKDGAGGVSLGR